MPMNPLLAGCPGILVRLQVKYIICTLTSGAINPAGRSKYGTLGMSEGSLGSRGIISMSGGGMLGLKSGGNSLGNSPKPGGGLEKSGMGGMGGMGPPVLGGGSMCIGGGRPGWGGGKLGGGIP